MKITRKKLQQIIKEETDRLIKEAQFAPEHEAIMVKLDKLISRKERACMTPEGGLMLWKKLLEIEKKIEEVLSVHDRHPSPSPTKKIDKKKLDPRFDPDLYR